MLELTADLTRDDNLLLRHALALKAMRTAASGSALQKDVADLRARHLASAQRGDRTHLREAARFHLQLLDDAAGALRLAQENWQVQKEPADVRILLESAVATRDPSARSHAIAWMQQTGLIDAQLTAIQKR